MKSEDTNAIAELYKHAVRTKDLETEALCQMALGLVVLGKDAKAAIATTPWAKATRAEAHAEVLRRIVSVH
jgi:hypothetical protein